jgi:hypothetical protein
MLNVVFSFFRRFLIPIILVVVLALLATAFFLGRYTVYQSNPELSSAEQTHGILTKVGALIQLPQNEAPQMAAINDAESAKQTQPFLVNAQNGDILIVYANAQMALLYRPNANKLIAVGPITSDTPSLPHTPESEQEESETNNATTTDEN